MTKFSPGRIALGTLLAIVSSIMLIPMLSFAQLFLFPPLIIAILYAWSGIVPACVSAVLSAGMLWLLGDATGLYAGSLLLILPGIGTIFLLKRRLPFARAITYQIAIQIGLMALMVLLLSLRYGTDLVGAFFERFRLMTDQMLSMSASGDMLEQLMLQMGRYGILGGGTGIDFTKQALTLSEQQLLMGELTNMMETVFHQNLASMLLSSGVMTSILSYSLSALICVRRGDEPTVDIVHLNRWRLPKHMIIGLPAVTLVLYIMGSSGLGSADAAYGALLNLCYLAFSVQGAGAVARRLKQSGMGRGRRVGLIIIWVVLMPRILALVGLYSALFGGQGIITETINKRNNSKGDE